MHGALQLRPEDDAGRCNLDDAILRDTIGMIMSDCEQAAGSVNKLRTQEPYVLVAYTQVSRPYRDLANQIAFALLGVLNKSHTFVAQTSMMNPLEAFC